MLRLLIEHPSASLSPDASILLPPTYSREKEETEIG